MKVRAAAILALLTLVNWSCVAGQTKAPSIDVPKLVLEVQTAGANSSKSVFEYSWTSRIVVRRFNKNGRVAKEIDQEYEVYPSPAMAFVVQKLVKENGTPLSRKRAEKEQERINAEMASAEVAEENLLKNLPPSNNDSKCKVFGVWTTITGAGGIQTSLGASDFLCFGEFFSPHIERREGRDTVVLKFRPAQHAAPNSGEKIAFSRLVGVLWIDLEDKTITRIEAWPLENAPQVAESAFPVSKPPIIFEYVRLPSGMWARRSVYIDTRPAPAAFNGLSIEWKQDFTDYKRYYAQPAVYKADDPKPPISPPQ